MGFGACQAMSQTSRQHCKAFYWDLSSIIAKTACLATFLIVEGPRRLVFYAARKPEPKPFFTCRRWGYRMCACGHHYYCHDHAPRYQFFSPEGPPEPPKPQPQLAPTPSIDSRPHLETKSLVNPEDRVAPDLKAKTKRKRRRRWFWPF